MNRIERLERKASYMRLMEKGAKAAGNFEMAQQYAAEAAASGSKIDRLNFQMLKLSELVHELQTFESAAEEMDDPDGELEEELQEMRNEIKALELELA